MFLSKTFILVVPYFFHCICLAQPTDLFITEYVEGSANNKALEIYNGTNAAINLKDSAYVIDFYFNGNSVHTTRIVLEGTILPGRVFIVAHTQATFLNYNGGAVIANQTSGAGWFNGDDAIALKKTLGGETILDIFGQIGIDPGQGWGSGVNTTTDHTLRRKPAICKGNGIAHIFDPREEWVEFEIDDYLHLGQHTVQCRPSQTTFEVDTKTLNFISFLGSPTQAKKITITANQLTSEVVITAPDGFVVSRASTGNYGDSTTLPVISFDSGKAEVFIKFLSEKMDTTRAILKIQSGLLTTNISLLGITFDNQGTPIFKIQGTASTSIVAGHLVLTEGVVTASYQGLDQLNGFYIQDTLGDGNELSSDGIFIFNTSVTVQPGQYVSLKGEVQEYNGLTQITNISALSILSNHTKIKDTAIINFPLRGPLALEIYEGMLCKITQPMTVVNNYNLGRYGELGLAAGGILYTPTEVVDPNDENAANVNSEGSWNVPSVRALQSANFNRSIILDNASYSQNLSPVPYIDSSTYTIRVGSVVSQLAGVIDYAFGAFRMQPCATPKIKYATRPEMEAAPAGLKIASFNMLSFFNGDGRGGGFPTARGASTLVEFVRQKNKLINALSKISADIFGLMEMENDGEDDTAAISQLAKELSAGPAASYAFVKSSPVKNSKLGTDAIKVAIVYNAGSVKAIGQAYVDNNTVHNRPPLAQLFRTINGGEEFIVVVNHFKSKSCTGAAGPDRDKEDGQGCFNSLRKLQANALLKFVDSLQATLQCNKVVLLGDFNSYKQEDPLDQLRASGYKDISSNDYSYVFDGNAGTLDHFFFSPAIINSVVEVKGWHINADEPIFKDYNKEYNPPAAYVPDAYRSSDHDPAIAILNFQLQTGSEISTSGKISVHPNPATGNVYVNCPSKMFGNIGLQNIAGQEMDLSVTAVAEDEWMFNVSNIGSGLYILKINSGLKPTTLKLSVIH